MPREYSSRLLQNRIRSEGFALLCEENSPSRKEHQELVSELSDTHKHQNLKVTKPKVDIISRLKKLRLTIHIKV